MDVLRVQASARHHEVPAFHPRAGLVAGFSLADAEKPMPFA